MIFLGKHLIIDMWGVDRLDDVDFVQNIIHDAVAAAKATLLRSDFHDFGEGYGVTGVSLLSESHISIHTWPEHKFAAIDIYMCGDADPYLALQALSGQLMPDHSSVVEHKRGMLNVTPKTGHSYLEGANEPLQLEA